MRAARLLLLISNRVDDVERRRRRHPGRHPGCLPGPPTTSCPRGLASLPCTGSAGWSLLWLGTGTSTHTQWLACAGHEGDTGSTQEVSLHGSAYRVGQSMQVAPPAPLPDMPRSRSRGEKVTLRGANLPTDSPFAAHHPHPPPTSPSPFPHDHVSPSQWSTHLSHLSSPYWLYAAVSNLSSHSMRRSPFRLFITSPLHALPDIGNWKSCPSWTSLIASPPASLSATSPSLRE